jgi:hypothetical protein
MKKNAAVFIAVLAGIFFAEATQAAGLLPDCGGPGQGACTICHLFELINNIITGVIIALVPAAAGLVIAIAGFKMLINQNNAEVMAEAKKIILMVIIGLLLIYGSFAIVTAIFKGMGYVGDNPLQFNNVNCPAAP